MSEVEYQHLAAGTASPALAQGPFKAVIIADIPVDEAWRYEIARRLISSGCLYAVAWGVDCSRWEDSIDWAHLEASDFQDVPDDRFVMTTSHADESREDALWFAAWAAHHPTVDLTRTLIVHVAGSSREAEILEAYSQAQRDN